MRRTIYKELIIIFIAVLLFSNIITGIFVTLSYVNTTIEDMKDSLIASVEEAKDIYSKYDISQEDMNYLFKDKTIPVIFLDNTEGYNLTLVQELRIKNGECILIDTGASKVHRFPVAISMVDDIYIVSDIAGHSIFRKVKEIITLNSSIAIILGSLIFLVVGKMTIKPIKEITDATKKVATGNFDVKLINNRKDELGELIDSFNTMTDELKSIEILRNDFVSDISHEFKTPITSIEGYTKLLLDCEDENRNDYIDIILSETRRLTILTTNILTLNKLEHEDISNTEEFRLDEQIRKSILLLENKWNEKNLELDVNLEEIKFIGNKGLINQIWINLLDNAIKFSSLNGIISITLNDHKDKCEFIIEDHGIGVNPDDKSRIFEKFYKSDRYSNEEGTGLGLSIVKRIVDLHEGSISIDSDIGKGTKIIVLLTKKS